jgi:pimeloyl-ACP methyl ester carboxylesterase
MADIKSEAFETSTGRIAYREAGSGGVPLVCLHGLGGGALSWTKQLEQMSGDRRVIAWDCPGYGGSADHAIPSPAPSDYADALAELLRGIGVNEPIDLIGHSMGGVIAPQLEARHPGSVRRMVLSATRIGFRDWGSYEQRLQEQVDMTPEEFGKTRAQSMCAPGASDQVKAAVASIASEIRTSGYRAAVHVLSVSDNRAEVASMGIPVLVLAGAEDKIAPEQATAALTEAIPGAYREIIGQAAHAAYMEQPEAYNARLRAFLDS